MLALALMPFASWAQSDEKVPGEVRKVDRDNQKITIKHGEIKSFDMPPMTMVFIVKDPALLDAAKPGDKVRFGVAREEGKFVVTAIETAP
jgi:Cu/Ag efflux protein CusF